MLHDRGEKRKVDFFKIVSVVRTQIQRFAPRENDFDRARRLAAQAKKNKPRHDLDRLQVQA